MSNNMQTLFAAMIPNLRCVGVKFCDQNGSPMGREYTYKTLDPTIEVNQKVIVDTPVSGLTVVQVVSVSGVEAMDNKTVDYKWVVQKVDTTEYQALLEKDAQLAHTIKLANQAAAIAKARKEFEETLAAAGLDSDAVINLKSLLEGYNTK